MTDRIEPPLLETRRLSMGFGGLAALRSIDFRVERGQICSLIGPNGAGKTTLFNCISGVLRPTSGMIVLAGRDVRPGFGWRPMLAVVCAGLVTGIFAMCLAWNVNGLWRAAIRRPMHMSGRPFSYQAALNGAVDYFQGELAVERQGAERWAVVTADAQELLATARTATEADELKEAYEKASRGEPIEMEMPIGKRDMLARVSAKRRAKPSWCGLALVGGFMIGSLGMLSVWNRARWTPEIVAAAGVGRTFQNLRLFNRMTVLENVLVAMEAADHRQMRKTLTEVRSRSEPSSQPLAEARRLLTMVGLNNLAKRLADELSYGDARRLEIARALATHPRLLLLDEPAAGMNATETAGLVELLRQIRSSGVTVILIEHEMDLVMGISDHVVVLDYGRKIAEGPPDRVRHNPAVIEAYLGVDTEKLGGRQ
jgi:branched-chain amino acid transport system ATP-binding protein